MSKSISAYALEQAAATLQRALADEPDADGVLADPAAAEADLMDKLHAVLRGAVEAERLAKACADAMNDLRERKDRFAARGDRLRAAAFAVMDVLGEKKLEFADITISLKQNPPRTIITDEAALPEEFWRVSRVVDQVAISAALKAGAVLPGAELSNQFPSLQIRTR